MTGSASLAADAPDVAGLIGPGDGGERAIERDHEHGALDDAVEADVAQAPGDVDDGPVNDEFGRLANEDRHGFRHGSYSSPAEAGREAATAQVPDFNGLHPSPGLTAGDALTGVAGIFPDPAAAGRARRLAAASRKGARRRAALKLARAQAGIEAAMAGAPRGTARGDYSVREILDRIRAASECGA